MTEGAPGTRARRGPLPAPKTLPPAPSGLTSKDGPASRGTSSARQEALVDIITTHPIEM